MTSVGRLETKTCCQLKITTAPTSAQLELEVKAKRGEDGKIVELIFHSPSGTRFSLVENSMDLLLVEEGAKIGNGSVDSLVVKPRRSASIHVSLSNSRALENKASTWVVTRGGIYAGIFDLTLARIEMAPGVVIALEPCVLEQSGILSEDDAEFLRCRVDDGECEVKLVTTDNGQLIIFTSKTTAIKDESKSLASS